MGRMKKRSARRKTAIAAQLEQGEQRQDVTIVDASETGLLLRCTHPPEEGAQVAVLRRSQRIGGTVAWARGRRIGIAADAPIDLALLTSHASIGEGVTERPRVQIETKPRWWHWRSRD